MRGRDPLSAARGILVGHVIALGVWAVIAAIVVGLGLVDLPPMPWSGRP